MELKSTVVTLNNLLMLNFDGEFNNFVMPQKTKLSIPDYQREYKWEKSKIKTFVDNVMQRNKFLGIITTEVSNEEYLSVVDGQQRLTTIILMLSQIYNVCADEGETETQNEIQALLSYTINGQTFFKLENESIGEYLLFFTDINGRKKMQIEIDPDKDIYKQSKKFHEAYEIIQIALDSRDRSITLDTYKQRLVDCEMLLFAQKNPSNMQQGSSEEIYIDINEKSQRLDPEDIFKGHCFALCKTVDQQNQVKELWRSCKKLFFSMDSFFKKADMGTFLHFFLLTQEAVTNSRKDVKKDLTIDGENIISYRYNTPTKAINLLKNIELYQSNLLEFSNDLNSINHTFPKVITTTLQVLRNNTVQLKEANSILRDIFDCNQNLFKLPLFFLIDKNYRKDTADKLSYESFIKFIYLYYIYMFLFSRIGGSRKRSNLPSKLMNKISLEQDYLVQFIREIIDYAGDFSLDNKSINNKLTRKQLYNILDKFEFTVTNSHNPVVHDNEISFKFRLFPEVYNLEHLIINRSHTIEWCSEDGTEYSYSNNDFHDCVPWNSQNNEWSNFIWIDETFNRVSLENKDIINKIILLRGNAIATNPPEQETYAKKHYHIEMLCRHIMDTEGFSELLVAYSNNDSRENILVCYRRFIDRYFNEGNIDILRTKFETEFKNRLNDLKALIQ